MGQDVGVRDVRPPSATRAVLADREFRALLVADGLSVVGDQIARIAVALLVLERSGSAFAASATYACSYLTWLVGGPFLSAVADRFPRRRVMVVCDLLRMALIAVLAVPDLPLWVVFSVLVLVGLLAPPFDAAKSALLAELLPGERYVIGNALTNAVQQAGQLLGFVGGGALVLALQVEGALLVDAGTFAASALLLATLVRERSGHAAAPVVGGRWSEAVAGFVLVAGEPRLRALLGWGLLSATAVIAPEGLAVAVAHEDGRGAFAAGVLTAAVPAGFLVGSWLVLRLPVDRRERLFPAMVALSCLPLLATAVVEDVVALTALWAVAGMGNALQLVANSSFVQAVPPHLRGRAFGVAATLLMAVQGVVLLGAGALAEATGPRPPVAAIALLSLALVPFLPRPAPTALGAAAALGPT
jgi:MFS family permease